MIYNPQNITKCLSTQAVYIKPNYGNMYYYTDKGQIWYDTQNNSRILANDIIILYFEQDRANFIPEHYYLSNIIEPNTNPENQSINFICVYVIETNSLYQYNCGTKTWSTLYGTWGQNLIAQTYYPNGNIVKILDNDVTGNGILGDGSVVVRDKNMMICGLLLSDGYTFTIKSLIGGQLNLDPSSIEQGEGCLQLNSKVANLNGDLVVFGDIKVTNKENWSKQYSLVTQDIQISDYCLIKKDSLIKSGSKINNETYSSDTILTEDLETTSVGLIVSGSKIYIQSIINGGQIKPPFVFDIPESEFRRL